MNEFFDNVKTILEYDIEKEFPLKSKIKEYTINNKILHIKEIESKFQRVFVLAFENLSSNTRDLISSYSGKDNFKVRIGNYGFGLKYTSRTQVSKVQHVSSIGSLYERKDEVIEALKNIRKWDKAEEFEKFMDMYEKINKLDTSSIIISLPQNVELINFEEGYSWEQGSTKISKFMFDTLNYNNNNTLTVKNDINNNYYNVYFALETNSMLEMIQYIGIYNTDKIKKYYDLILKTILDEIKNRNTQLKVIEEEIEANFGKYFMFKKL